MAATPTTAVSIELIGWRNHKGQFAAVSAEGIKAQQVAVKSYLGDVLRRAQELSPYDNRDKLQGVDPAKTKYHDDTHFRDEWRVNYQATETGSEGDVTNYSSHANLVIFSTSPHPISGKTSRHQLLAFNSGSEPIFTHSVQHPGTKGNDIPAKIEREFGTPAAYQRLQNTAVQAFQSSFYGYFARYGK